MTRADDLRLDLGWYRQNLRSIPDASKVRLAQASIAG